MTSSYLAAITDLVKACVRIATGAFLILSLPVFAQITSPAAFLDAYREALQSKSVEKMDALAYRAGMSASDKQAADELLQKQLERNTMELDDVSFGTLPLDYAVGRVSMGIRWEPTHLATGLVKATYRQSHSQTTTSVPYAIIDGVYYLIQSRRIDVGWKGPPDHLFVVETKSNVPGIQIAVEWNASGVEQKGIFHQPRAAIVGQYIEKATATNPNDFGEMTLLIQSAGNDHTVRESTPAIFRSQPLAGRGTLTYTKS